MKSIWKYPLKWQDEQVIEIPLCGNGILSAGPDPTGNVCVWAEVDTERESKYTCTFRIVGTGNPLLEDNRDFVFVDTVVSGVFVWHVYVHLG